MPRLDISHDRDPGHYAVCYGPVLNSFSVLTNFSFLVAYLFIVFAGFVLIALAALAVTLLSQLFELLLVSAQLFTLLVIARRVFIGINTFVDVREPASKLIAINDSDFFIVYPSSF